MKHLIQILLINGGETNTLLVGFWFKVYHYYLWETQTFGILFVDI